MKPKKITKLYGVELKPRVIIQPKSSVSVASASEKVQVMRSVRKVMSEHRGVLIALKDR